VLKFLNTIKHLPRTFTAAIQTSKHHHNRRQPTAVETLLTCAPHKPSPAMAKKLHLHSSRHHRLNPFPPL